MENDLIGRSHPPTFNRNPSPRTVQDLDQEFECIVYPLNDVVLFPGTAIPLEAREMVEHRLLMEEVVERGMRVVFPYSLPQDNGLSGISAVCTEGMVEGIDRAPTGTASKEGWVSLVHGIHRVKLGRVIQEKPYLVMTAQICKEDQMPFSEEEKEHAELLLVRLRTLARTGLLLRADTPGELITSLDDFNDPGHLADFYAFHFIHHPLEQLQYLECVSPLERARKLLVTLEGDVARMKTWVVKQKSDRTYH